MTNARYLSTSVSSVLATVARWLASVTGGHAAVDAAAQLGPDVLVLDVSMPILNGIQAARRSLEGQRRHQDCVPHGQPKILIPVRAAMETGACGYVLKPRLASDLIQPSSLQMMVVVSCPLAASNPPPFFAFSSSRILKWCSD